MSYKLQNTRYLHCLNNFNICYYDSYSYVLSMSALLYNPSVRWCTILLESPSVLTTPGSDIRQQSFINNTFTVIQAVYVCSRFNASFAHMEDANRNHHVMHLTRVGNSKRVSLFGTHCRSVLIGCMCTPVWDDSIRLSSLCAVTNCWHCQLIANWT